MRICYADGTIRGYVGVNNDLDVRMGAFHSLTLIDSTIDEGLIDDSSCGSGSNDDSFILRQSSFNLKLKDTTGSP